MLKFYDKEGREITNKRTKCVCDNPACLGEPWCSARGICTALGSGETTSTTEFSDFGLEDKYDNLFCELSQHEDSSPTYTAEFPHFSSTVGTTDKPTLQDHLSSSLSQAPVINLLISLAPLVNQFCSLAPLINQLCSPALLS